TATFGTSLSTAGVALTINSSVLNGASPVTLTNPAGSTLTVQSSTLGSNMTLANAGTLLLGGGTNLNGPLTTASTSDIQIIGSNTFSSTSVTVANGFTNNGTIELLTQNQAFSTALTVTNGSLTNAAGATITSQVGTLGARTMNVQLDNQGSFIVQQPVLMQRATSAISNSGTIDLTAADLTISQFGAPPISFANTGTVTIGAGHTLTISGGTFTQSGTLSGAGTVALSGVTSATFNTAIG